jgi:TorA maturation chaperone TorD
MERSLARSNTYHILSRCFTYPDERIYSWIWEGEWLIKLRHSLSLLADNNFEGYLIAFEEGIDGKQKVTQVEMAREYARFFDIVSLHAVDPPCDSIDLEKGTSALEQANTEELRFFHEAGFTLREDLEDRSDHIVSKLELMGILADQESRVSGGEKIRLEEVQLAFLSGYIIPWVPTFCEKVTKQNGLPFYCVLGELTREFISFEKDYLGFTEEIDLDKDRKSETPRRFI